MNRIAWLLALAVGLAAGGTAAGDDEKKGEKAEKPAKPGKAPDWSKYASAGVANGVIVKAGDDGLTLNVSGVVVLAAGNRRRGSSSSTRRVSDDYDLAFAEGAMVRWKKAPPKVGADGKKEPYTPAELEKMRLPMNTPGYAAEVSDLSPGKVVEVHLLRPRDVPAAKATEEDLRVKYVVIYGETTPPTPREKK